MRSHREAGLEGRVLQGDGHLDADLGKLTLGWAVRLLCGCGQSRQRCPRDLLGPSWCQEQAEQAAMPTGPPGAATVPCVPLQHVTDEEPSRHLMFLLANEIAPNQCLICMLQGHVLCKHCRESKHDAATGFSMAR